MCKLHLYAVWNLCIYPSYIFLNGLFFLDHQNAIHLQLIQTEKEAIEKEDDNN